MIKDRVDLASELWMKYSNHHIDEKDKAEIAHFVNVRVVASLRNVLFPGLPVSQASTTNGSAIAAGVAGTTGEGSG